MDRSLVTVRQGQWSSGLCDCDKDPVGFCEAFLCTYSQITYQRSRLLSGETDIDGFEFIFDFMDVTGISVGAFCKIRWLYQSRTPVRRSFGIEGSACGDCCINCWCHSCSVAQTHREMCYRGVYPGGAITSPPRNEPMGDPAHRLPRNIAPLRAAGRPRKISILNTNLTAVSGLLILVAPILFGIAPGTVKGYTRIDVPIISHGICLYTFDKRECFPYRYSEMDAIDDPMFRLSGLLSYSAVPFSGAGLVLSVALNIMGIKGNQKCISVTAVLVVRLLKLAVVLTALSLGVGALATAISIRNSKEFSDRALGQPVQWRDGFYALVAAVVSCGVAGILDVFVLLKIREGPLNEAVEATYQSFTDFSLSAHPRATAAVGTNTEPLLSAVVLSDSLLNRERFVPGVWGDL